MRSVGKGSTWCNFLHHKDIISALSCSFDVKHELVRGLQGIKEVL